MITVKTYPWPHKKYREVVCTAGVKEDGTFIRLFPVPFRYMPPKAQFKKYQWIEAELERYMSDPRPDTFVPRGEIELIGHQLPSSGTWEERRRFVLAKDPAVMCSLERERQPKRTLGIIRVREVISIRSLPGKTDWQPEEKFILERQDLFDGFPKMLLRIPFSFHFKFLCEDDKCKSHEKTILDWEVGALFLKEKQRRGEKAACQNVLDRLRSNCSPEREVYFFVGTLASQPKPTWSIMGMFYPRKRAEPDLTFDL